MRNICRVSLIVGLVASFSGKAEIVQVTPDHQVMIGNYVTAAAAYSACAAELNRIGQAAEIQYTCGNSNPIPPGQARNLYGGNFVDRTQPPGVYKFLYIDIWACADSKTMRYFSDKRQCLPIAQQTSPAPTNPKGNGPVCRQPTCGNPIVIGTGNKVQLEHDYLAVTAGLPLESTRTYNGGVFAGEITSIGYFGSFWSHPIDRKIEVKSNQSPIECFTRYADQAFFCAHDRTVGTGKSALVTRSDGRVLQFKQSGTAWIGEADVDERLTAEYDTDGVTPLAWILTTASQHQERYSANGKLLSVSTRSGIAQRFTYSTGSSNDTRVSRWPDDAPVCSNIQAGAAVPAGLPICVTDNWGRQLQFEYDGKNRVNKMIDPANQSYLYQYDGTSGGCFTGKINPACRANNLTSVTYPGGKTRTYSYNEIALINNGASCSSVTNAGNGFGHLMNALTGITDENGIRYASWGWNCANRAISSEHAGGVEKVALSHGGRAADGSNSVAVTSYLGTSAAPQSITRNYHFKVALGVAKNDSVDQPCEGCDGMLERTYDANNNVLTSKDWLGSKKVFTYDISRNLETSRVEGHGTALARTITTEWHPTLRLRTRVAEPLRISSYTYDANGNMLSESIQATTDTNGSQGFQATVSGMPKTWGFSYNSVGQLLTKTGPGVNTTLTYDSEGNLATVTNAIGHVTRYDNYDVNGRAGQITDPNGLTTSYSYGPRGWLDSVSVGGELTTYTYDAVGNLKTATMPDGSTVTYVYDNARRLTDVIDSLGNKITYTLDLAGNRIGEDTKDAGGALTRKVARIFDTFNRLKQVTGAMQ